MLLCRQIKKLSQASKLTCLDMTIASGHCPIYEAFNCAQQPCSMNKQSDNDAALR